MFANIHKNLCLRLLKLIVIRATLVATPHFFVNAYKLFMGLRLKPNTISKYYAVPLTTSMLTSLWCPLLLKLYNPYQCVQLFVFPILLKFNTLQGQV
jgi:hypothetical protein